MQFERTLRPVGIEYHGNFVLFRKYACVKTGQVQKKKMMKKKGKGTNKGCRHLKLTSVFNKTLRSLGCTW